MLGVSNQILVKMPKTKSLNNDISFYYKKYRFWGTSDSVYHEKTAFRETVFSELFSEKRFNAG